MYIFTSKTKTINNLSPFFLVSFWSHEINILLYFQPFLPFCFFSWTKYFSFFNKGNRPFLMSLSLKCSLPSKTVTVTVVLWIYSTSRTHPLKLYFKNVPWSIFCSVGWPSWLRSGAALTLCKSVGVYLNAKLLLWHSSVLRLMGAW